MKQPPDPLEFKTQVFMDRLTIEVATSRVFQIEATMAMCKEGDDILFDNFVALRNADRAELWDLTRRLCNSLIIVRAGIERVQREIMAKHEARKGKAP